MPIAFACPGCAKQFKVPDEMAGRTSRCTQCGQPLVVPGSPAAVAAWQPAPQPVAPAMAMRGVVPGPYEIASGRAAMPASVVAALACLGVLAGMNLFSLFLSATTRGSHVASDLISLVVAGLLLAGLVSGNRLAWQWGRLVAPIAGVLLAFLWVLLLVPMLSSGGLVGLLLTFLVLLQAGLFLTVFFALGTLPSRQYFDLICPQCQKATSRPADFWFRSARCKACGHVWSNAAGSGRFRLSRQMMMVGGASAGVMLMVAMVWGGYKLFFDPSGLGDEVQYLPSNCQTVVSLRPEQILSSDAFKEIKKELAAGDKGAEDPELEMEKLAGIPLSNMQQVVIGVAATDSSQPEVVFVIKTLKPVTADDIAKTKKVGITPQETKVRNISVYEVFGMAWCLPDTKVVLFGKSDTLKKVLERNKAAELSEGLRATLKYVDFSKSIAVAMDSKELYAKVKEASKKNGMDLEQVFDKVGIANPMGDIDGGTHQIEFGKDIKVQSVMICKDAKTAEDMKVISDGMATFLKRLFPKYGADSFETWESSVSGARVHSSMTIKTESVLKLVRAIKELGKSSSSTFQQVGQQLDGQNVSPRR